jgi:nitrogen fixation NifU-like protein
MDSAEDIYQAAIMDRARRPRHQRALDPFDAEMRETNPLCGDRVTLRLRCDGDRIAAVGYEARACAICVAAADLMVEAVEGLTATEAVALGARLESGLRAGDAMPVEGPLAALRVFAPLHDTPSRIGCATLPWRALAKAIATASP